MSTNEIVAVAALSSGTLIEAEYFGKTIQAISHSYINYYKGIEEYKKDDFIILRDEYFSPTFWSEILSPILVTKECRYFNFNNRKNFLRNSLNAWWGYEIGKETAVTGNVLSSIEKVKQKSILNGIFSINNEFSNNKKHKVIKIFGIKIKLDISK